MLFVLNISAKIRKFKQMECLTAPLLRKLIDRIKVFKTEGISKNRTQRIVICYRFVGYVELPKATPKKTITKRIQEKLEQEAICFELSDRERKIIDELNYAGIV